MEPRIARLQQKTLAGEMWIEPIKTEYDRMDLLLLRPVQRSAKRVYEYILNQEPLINEDTALTGYIRFDGSVEGEIFNRFGHKAFETAIEYFYNKPVNNLSTFEWQHSVADYPKLLAQGIKGYKKEIAESIKNHTEEDQLDFLYGLDTVCNAIIGWANKCALRAEEKAEKCEDLAAKSRLLKLSAALKKVPLNPASNFYEAVLSEYFCYAFTPDSIGTIDRYFYKYYVADLESGKITREEAKAYLQELFLTLQWRISIKSDRFTRGGESHFCIGGYTENGEDGFNELSQLIVESLMEMETYIPQISLRWTKKTPSEVLYYMMDCERKDSHKRIAFVNDEPRIQGFMEIGGMSYKDAVSYTMVGCNEPAIPGGMVISGGKPNIGRFIVNVFQERAEDVLTAKSFEDFYHICEEELHKDIDEILLFDDLFNRYRAQDINLVSSMFFEGCIENAKSLTQGGGTRCLGNLAMIGFGTVIDSIIVVKQFVYDDQLCTMEELVNAVRSNWIGYEDLHSIIAKKADFFGNDDERSNAVAQMFYESLYNSLKSRRNVFGKPFIVGNLNGYNQHNVWFGAEMKATPDGRYDYEPISFGRGQSNGRDRNGITALLNSVAKCDRHRILCGPDVTNVLVDEVLVKNDENFKKLVKVFEAYFKNGGQHFQLNYMSKEDLIKARKTPAEYRNLRVRVSGYSDYFVILNEDIQDEIIQRTSHSC